MESNQEKQEVSMVPYTLGTIVMKYSLPMNMIDAINKAYDESKT